MALRPLRYNTNNQNVIIGPFCNSTDGVTRLTSLTITNNDVKLMKNNATASNNKSAGNGTHVVNGQYYVTLNAADTDVYGPMRVDCAMNGSAAVWEDFIVMSPSAYNALAGANNFQADTLSIAANAVTAAAFNQAAADKVWATAARTLTASSNIFSANAITADSFNQAAADKVWATAGRTLTSAANITTNNNKLVLHTDDKVLLAGTNHTNAVIPTVSTLTGHTAQTGDTFALANGVAGFVAINADVEAILADTDELQTNQGDWATATGFSTHSAADVWGATNATLSLTYAVIASRLYRFLCNKMNITDLTGSVVLYDEAGSGTIATQSITDDSTDTLRTALSWA